MTCSPNNDPRLTWVLLSGTVLSIYWWDYDCNVPAKAKCVGEEGGGRCGDLSSLGRAEAASDRWLAGVGMPRSQGWPDAGAVRLAGGHSFTSCFTGLSLEREEAGGKETSGVLRSFLQDPRPL